MMKRTQRPALKDDWDTARAYASADFSRFVDRFVALFQQKLPLWYGERRVLDLGCGAARVAIRLAHACGQFRIHGIDASYPMLAFAEQAVLAHGLRERVEFEHLYLPSAAFRPEAYDVVISDRLLHLLADPATLWSAVREATRPGSGVFVMDLLRPDSEERAGELAAEAAGSDSEALRQDLLASLLAAYTVEEVRAQLNAAGLAMLKVEAISDLHLLVHGDRLFRDDPMRPLWSVPESAD